MVVKVDIMVVNLVLSGVGFVGVLFILVLVVVVCGDGTEGRGVVHNNYRGVRLGGQ